MFIIFIIYLAELFITLYNIRKIKMIFICMLH